MRFTVEITISEPADLSEPAREGAPNVTDAAIEETIKTAISALCYPLIAETIVERA